MKSLYSIITLIIIFVAVLPHDTLQATPLREISVRYQFNLATWEPSRLPIKWVYKIGWHLFPIDLKYSDRVSIIEDFLLHKKKLAKLDNLMNEAAIGKDSNLELIEEQFIKATKDARSIQMNAEEAFESAISDTIRSEKIPSVMRRAFNEANSHPKGPVYVGFTANALEGMAEMNIIPSSPVYDSTIPDPEGIKEATDLLMKSQNPLLIVGDRVSDDDGMDAAVELAELTGMPVYQSR